jgi:hypothetical protein
MEREQRALSFVITYENPTGQGFHGQPGYVGLMATASSEQGRDEDRRLAIQYFR